LHSRNDITFIAADDKLKTRIQQEWPSNAGDFICLDENSFSLVALAAGTPVGAVSAHKRALAEPLCTLHEAFISIVEVSEDYRRRGIGRALVEAVIAWAGREGMFQVGAWSMKTRSEVLHLWRKLGFTFAQIDTPQQTEAPYGFYVTKRI